MIVSNLNKQLGNKEVLKNVSFTIDSNDKIGLVGVNGAGKSTLLKILSNELNQDNGKIKLIEENIFEHVYALLMEYHGNSEPLENMLIEQGFHVFAFGNSGGGIGMLYAIK